MDIKTTKQPDGSWVAIDADNYEVEYDSEGWWSKSPAGYGRDRDRSHSRTARRDRGAPQCLTSSFP